MINIGKYKGGPSTFKLSWNFYPTCNNVTWKLHEVLRNMTKIGIVRTTLGLQIWRKYEDFHKIGQSW